jgi:DNA-binding response OmpR family regulator
MPKVLLAEDNVTMVRLLGTLLAMEGFQVESVAGDEDVLLGLQRSLPDILLLDVIRPHRSGLDILDEIRRSEDFSGLPVIMMSGLSLQDECMSHGADDFLLKPFLPEQLMGMLRKHLERTV